LQWDGEPGHYEVYYLTFTDPGSGVGVWIRYTMLSPLSGPATAALWFLAMDPNVGVVGRKQTRAIEQLTHEADPFELRIGDATLTDRGMRGAFEDVAWDLRWQPGRAYEHVPPALRPVASTVLVLPHADVAVSGTVGLPGRALALDNVRGGQAHLWGRKHAQRWAWVHCNDFETQAGEAATDTFIDGVSVLVSRFGRTIGPATPFVGRIDGEDFRSTTPLRLAANHSSFALTGWRFEAVAGARKVTGEVDADRGQLAGVTYHDPDGELTYCYNSETASIRLHVYERARQVGGWAHKTTLIAPGRAHFEYAQREPVPGIELLTR
jgi:hypothetical protein